MVSSLSSGRIETFPQRKRLRLWDDDHHLMCSIMLEI
jgi:hypothetical protein